MKQYFLDILSTSMVLFAVIDIIGSTPIVVDLRKKFGRVNSEKATIVSAIIMISFLFLGDYILALFSVDIESFATAGAIIMSLIALEMILGIRIYHSSEKCNSVHVVPIAFPLIAGAGSLTTIISLKSQYDTFIILSAILINMVIVYVILKSTSRIEKIIGEQGIEVLRRVFGIILLTISVKIFRSVFA